MVAATVATHSPQAEALREELLDELGAVGACSGDVPFFSTVAGGPLDTAELDAEYWYRNTREMVRFEEAIRGLLHQGCRTFIEVSPHPVLTVGAQETVDTALGDAGEVVITGSLRRGQGGLERFMTALAEVHVRGVNVDWGAVAAGPGVRRRVDLPTYAFQRRRFWLEPRAPQARDDTRDASEADPGARGARGARGGGAVGDGDRGEAGDAILRDDGSFAQRVAGMREGERDRTALELVRAQVAIVLGHDSPEDVPPRRAFTGRGAVAQPAAGDHRAEPAHHSSVRSSHSGRAGRSPAEGDRRR
jgi:acyl transferase domain-containing protein